MQGRFFPLKKREDHLTFACKLQFCPVINSFVSNVFKGILPYTEDCLLSKSVWVKSMAAYSSTAFPIEKRSILKIYFFVLFVAITGPASSKKYRMTKDSLASQSSWTSNAFVN